MPALPKHCRVWFWIWLALAVMALPALMARAQMEAAAGPQRARGSITIFAPASASGAIDELARQFQQETGVTVHTSFAASSTLARQIEAGAPADLFLSADTQWMDYLAERDLITAGSRADLLANDLVLIAPRDQVFAVEMEQSFAFTAALPGRLAIADPEHVPAGRYARSALRWLGWWTSIEDRLLPAADVRAALALVETGAAAAGVVYGSDAAGSQRVAVLGRFPAASHEPIVYPVALCKESRQEAREFLSFLQEPAARMVFQRWGFSPATAQANVTARARQSANGGATTQPRQSFWSLRLSAAERSALLLSLQVAGVCVLLSLLPAIGLAWALVRTNFPGKAAVEAMVHLPLVLPPVVVGYLLLLALGHGSPVGRYLEDSLGLPLAFRFSGAVLAAAVMGFPLLVGPVRLAIELVDVRLEQAARTLGASPLRLLLTVTLPLALPGIITGMVLCFARSLGEFGATITFAGSIAGETRTLPTAIYTFTQVPGGEAPALRLVLFSIALSVAALGTAQLISHRARKFMGL